MLPAHECFHSRELKATHTDLWLILNDKLSAFESRSQITFEHELLERACRSPRGVKLKDVTALHLRAIECRARSLHKTRGGATALRIATDADADRNEDLLIFKKELLIESLLDRAGDVLGILRARNLR